MAIKMKVAIYARVSTDDKDQDPARQIPRCQQYADDNRHEVIGVFTEFCTGDSNPLERPQFKALMDASPDGVLVFSIDRLSRQHPNKIMQILGYFKATGLKIISVTEPIFNMESEMAEPMRYFITWWNNYFLKKLKTDIKSGMDRARAQGKQIGRSKVKFNQFRAFQLLIIEKKSLSEASKELGVSRATLCRFSKVAGKNLELFIKERDISQTGVFGTDKEAKK